MNRFAMTFSAIGALALAGSAAAQADGDIQVSVTNEGNSDFFLTPVWFAFQDGSFDFFDAGSSASASLEALAEDGVVGGLQADFAASGVPGNIQGVAANADGFGGAPVIDPGETATAFVTPINPANYQYFSFASMVIPSNDTFIGNDSATAYQVFDASGQINDASGTFTIQVFGRDAYDGGTEVNNGFGAAFSTIGGTPTDENGVIASASDLAEFTGTGTPAGTTIGGPLPAGELLATIEITVVPAPGALAALAAGSLFAVRRRR